MLTSRIDTLQAPRGAGRAPFIAYLTLATIAGAMVLVGLSGLGWFMVLLVPAFALTLYILLNTLFVLRVEHKAKKLGEREEDSP